MSKTVYKLRPTDYHKIGQFESWLYDMSAKGLHLKRFGLFLAKFEKSEPKPIRYRLDIKRGKQYLAEQDLFYAQNGWELITHYGDFSVYAAPETANIPELHTDPVEQASSLKKFEYQYGLLTVGSIVFFLWIIFSFYRPWVNGQFLEVSYNDWSDRLLSLMLISMCAGFFLDWYKLRSTRRQLLAGKPIDHHAPWKATFYTKNVYNIAIMMVATIVFIMSMLSIFSY